MSKEVVLCVSNAYQKKYYLNENFNGLPQTIRDELKIMCERRELLESIETYYRIVFLGEGLEEE